VQDVVTSYNAAISLMDTATDAQNGGILAGDNKITSLRNQIRSMFTSQVAGLSSTAYDSVQQVGIGTAATVAGGQATPNISVDTVKLTAALIADPAKVKQLFIAQDLPGTTSSNDDGMDGIFTQMGHLLSDKTYTTSTGTTAYGALYSGGDGNSGIFPQYQTTAAARIKALDDSITAAQDRMTQKQATLQQQFTAMDQLIGQYQSQGSAITGLINQLNANKG
jgi:flagellar capping protein FliD